ncbi:protein Aster-B isoform X5 [Ciona intestinalis]
MSDPMQDLPHVTVTSPSLDSVVDLNTVKRKEKDAVEDILKNSVEFISKHQDRELRRPATLSLPSSPAITPTELSLMGSSPVGIKVYDSDSSWVSHVTVDDGDAIKHIKNGTPKKVRQKLQKMKDKLSKKRSSSDPAIAAHVLDYNGSSRRESETSKGGSKHSSGDPGTPPLQPLHASRSKKKKTSSKSKAKRFYKNAIKKTSELQVLNPSYKQKNVDFHKFFKKLPETERLLVDHSCALMKDILVQGRMYVSQNYVCFHSNILKWQTAVMLSFKDIVSLTKEKTVKLFPNAIQFQIKGRVKHTFTSFTSRDRAYHQIFRLWQNALLDKPMTPHELWGVVRNQYGSDLGCSSDDDYVRPNGVFDYRGVDFATPTEEIYKFGTTNKIQRSKYSQLRHANNDVTDGRQMTSEGDNLVSISDRSSEGDKSLSGCSLDDDDVVDQMDDDSGPAEFGLPDFNRTYLVREYECSAAELFNIIYGDTCPFWKLYLEKRQTFDITITKWKDGEAENQGYKVRSLNYNLTLNNPLGPKSSNVDEVQVCYKHEPCRYYTVDCTAHTHGVPYSDYFSTVMRYQIRKLGKSTCELRVSAQLVFNKTPWGLVKNFIEKNCYSGIEENFQMLEPELDSYVVQLNVKRKQTSESPVREYPRQRISISSSGGRRRQSNKCSLESSPTIADTSLRNGDVTHNPYDVGKGDVIGAPTTTSPAAPEWDLNNNDHGKVKSEINGKKNGRFFKVVMTFAFAVLLLSNYSLYSRLNSLEQSNSIRVFDDVTTLHTKLVDGELPLLDALKIIERRLAKLENVLQHQVTSSKARWDEMNSDWIELRQMMNQVLKRSSKSDKT